MPRVGASPPRARARRRLATPTCRACTPQLEPRAPLPYLSLEPAPAAPPPCPPPLALSAPASQIEPANPESETLADMAEYGIASAIFFAMLETQACETAQRVTAMDNASTNAKDMVDRFKLIYNRARQSQITTELTEVSGGWGE